MDIREKFINLKNSILNSILERLKTKKALQEEETNGQVDISLLSQEEREKAFIEFSEGNKDLLELLTTAYDHGLESMYCCSGHGKNGGYILFKVNEDNLKQIQEIGKVLSYEEVSTNFEYHHELGFRVAFHGIKTDNSWFSKATETIINPPDHEIIPKKYYHETPTHSYQPLLFRIKQRTLDILKKWSASDKEEDSPNQTESIDVNIPKEILEENNVKNKFIENLRKELSEQEQSDKKDNPQKSQEVLENEDIER